MPLFRKRQADFSGAIFSYFAYRFFYGIVIMLDKASRAKLPVEYDFKKTEWSIKLKAGLFSYKRKLVIISFLFTSLIPMAFLASDLISGYTGAVFNYLIPLSCMYLTLCFLLRMENVRFLVTAPIVAAIAGFFLSAYLPHSRQVSLFILIVFIPFVFHLTGSRRGIYWSTLFLVSVITVYILSLANILPEWNIRFAESQVSMVSISIIIMLIILYTGQVQREKLLGDVIRHLTFDDTTGLPNKDTMLHSFPEGRGFILAIVRIHNFSELSSLFGYEIAEKILLFTARTFSKIAARDGYSCFKLLGHEYGLIIPEKEEEFSVKEATVLLNALWFELQSIKFIEGEKEYCPSYRIGASIVDHLNKSRALSMADLALNMADRLQHTVYIYNSMSDDKIQMEKSSRMYSILLDNIKNGLLKIVYQPVVDTKSGKICWYEALMRVRQEDGSYESILHYLPLARNTGLYNELTRFMLKDVFYTLLTSENDVSVNITLSDITHPGFMEEVINMCEAIMGRGSNLILEILESEELVEIDLCRDFIRTVQNLGCKIAIDDFGSGYSNFCTILNLSIDIVKIDGALMKSVESDENALNMIESITSFCHKSDKLIVAEYIDNEYLHDIAMSYDIQYCQGYHFGKPGDIPSSG